MNAVWISARKDLLRLVRDPVAQIVWIAIPLLTMVLIAAIFGGGATPQGKLLLVDQDKTFLSQALPGMFTRGPLEKMLLVETVEYDEGRKRLDRGDASALLVIPKGFDRAVLGRQDCKLTLLTNPSQRILPGIIEQTLTILLEGVFYWQTLFAGEIARYGDRTPSEADLIGTTLAVRQAVTKLRRYLDPPLIQLETHVVQDKKAMDNIGALFFPGLLFMAILGLSQSMSEDLWKERAFGTLKRFAVTPRPMAALLGGKLLSMLTLVLALAGVATFGAVELLHEQAANPILALLWCGAAGVALYLMMAAIQVYCGAENSGSTMTRFLVLILSLVGGTFFPFELMPAWMAAIGRLTPNGWVIAELKRILSGSAEPVAVAAGFAGMAFFSAAAFVLVAKRLRVEFTR